MSVRPKSQLFQSTPPVKAATGYVSRKRLGIIISIHAAREGGDSLHLLGNDIPEISIHAAREGGDVNPFFFTIIARISIHAAREGGDYNPSSRMLHLKYFNPRRP